VCGEKDRAGGWLMRGARWLVNACVNDYEMHLGKHSLEDLRMLVGR